MTISRHPGSCADPLPTCAVRPTRDSSLRSTRPPTVSPADFRSELDPRSLDPDRSFWSAFAELIRGQTSPADFCNVQRCASNQTRAPDDPRRDGGLDLLPFLERATPLPCGSSDPRRAALRPFATTPVLVPPTLVGLPNRDIVSTAPPPRPKPKCIARIDVHESADRAKDASPGRPHGCACDGCMRFVAHADDVPLLGDLRTSAVAGAPVCSGGCRYTLTDRPRPSFQRRPAKSAAFQKTRMPFTATTREGISREGF
jgi:hypothetical protein